MSFKRLSLARIFAVLLLGLLVACSSGGGGGTGSSGSNKEGENQAPVALISGLADHATTGSTLQASASGSYDPDGNILNYHWRLSVPAGSQVSLSSSASSAITISFTPDVAGVYTLELTVSDDSLSSAPVSASVKVVEPDPDTPIPPDPTPPPSGGEGITRVSLKSASAQSNLPISFGQVFAKGDVPAGQTLIGSFAETGEAVSLQVDRKASHGDGSLRHALITALLPALPANTTRTLVLKRGTGEASGAVPTVAGLLATHYDSEVTILLNGTRYHASARALLQAGSPDVWLQGPLVSEWLVSGPLLDDEGKPHPHLAAHFAVRAYAGYGRVRTDLSVENNWTYQAEPRNLSYDVTVSVDGQVRYQRTGLTHLHHARWRQVFWSGGEPAVGIAQDVAYLMATGAVPNYDPALIGHIAATELQRIRDFWTHEDKTYVYRDFSLTADKIGPMGLGMATQTMPLVGAHDDIGLLPRWAVSYLLSQDPVARSATLGMGDLAGSWSIHYRDRNTGLPVSIDEYPYASTTTNRADTKNPATGQYEQVAQCPTDPANACATTYIQDTAHQPSFAYLPYLLTGDYYDLEELQFWANYNLVAQTPAYRQFAKGLHHKGQEDRGQAWDLRTLGQATYITPDNHPLKAYFEDKLANNLEYFHGLYVDGQPNGYGALIPNYSYPTASPWMDDFWTAAMGSLVDMGFDEARPILAWKAKFPVQRMGFGNSNPEGYCWIFAAAYHLLVAPDVNSPMFATLAQAYAGTNGKDIPYGSAFDDHGTACGSTEQAQALGFKPGEMYGHSESPTGYPSNLQPALAAAVNSGIPGAAEAWQRFMARSVKPDYSNFPVWAVVPRVAVDGGGSAPGSGVPTAIGIAPGSLNLLVGGSQHLALTASYADGHQEAVTAGISWSSDKPNVASIDNQARVTGVAAGSARIQASYQGLTSVIPVTVSVQGAGVDPDLLPDNTWVKVEPTYVMPSDLPGARLQRGADGYGTIQYRHADGRSQMLWFDGVTSERNNPGFYANALMSWDVLANRVNVLDVSNFLGSSSGNSQLAPDFADAPKPAPRHVYDGLVYDAPRDSLFLVHGATWRNRINATPEALAALAQDQDALWQYRFSDGRWLRYDTQATQMLRDDSASFESHLWPLPDDKGMLWVDYLGDRHYRLNLSPSPHWERLTVDPPSVSMYNARSTWDSQRRRWVYRNGQKIGYYSVDDGQHHSLPDTGIEGRSVVYLSRYDRYLVIGYDGKDTRIFDPKTNQWQTLDVPAQPFDATGHNFLAYDAANDLVVLLALNNHFLFRYRP